MLPADYIQSLCDADSWSHDLFCTFKLGDRRINNVLMRWAAAQARQPEQETYALGDSSLAQSIEHLLRRGVVEPGDLLAASRAATLELARRCPGELLAIKDSTSVGFSHSLRDELALRHMGDLGGKGHARLGWWFHSCVLTLRDGMPLGLADQISWLRPFPARKSRQDRKQRPAEDKESLKWSIMVERAIAQWPAEILTRTRFVSDAESDVFGYLRLLTDQSLKFVVRVSQAHRLLTSRESLYETLRAQAVSSTMWISLKATSERKARMACLQCRIARVSLNAPKSTPKEEPRAPVEAWALLAREEIADEDVEPLEWLLLCEPDQKEELVVETAMNSYASRWSIERVHQAVIEGCRMEERTHRTPETMEKVMMMLWLVGVRLSQLEQITTQSPEMSCEEVFDALQWQVLWKLSEKRLAMPSSPPNLIWAWRALARISGWKDSNRTGRPGWRHLWRGLERLGLTMEGIELAQSLAPAGPPTTSD